VASVVLFACLVEDIKRVAPETMKKMVHNLNSEKGIVMADEQAQAEETALDQSVEEQTAVVDDNSSEAEQNTSETIDRGDLRVPLKEERAKRQELEANLNNPEFIYQKARELGLTEEEVKQEVQQEINNTPAQGLSFNTYQYYRSLEKAQEKYPQLVKKEEYQVAITSLMQRENLTPEKAADKFFSEFSKIEEKAKAEGATKAIETKAKEELNKERAQTVDASISTSQDAQELEDLILKSKSLNKQIQTEAHIELLKRKNKKLGLI